MAKHKYKIKLDILDNIDSEKKAYFLGFFYADGYNNQTQGKLVIRLQARDKQILEEFSDIFFFERPKLYYILNKTNGLKKSDSYTLCITSRKLSDKMGTLGAPQCKSFFIRFPFWLDDDLLRFFIRGYFDGDGSCSRYKRKRNNVVSYQICFACNEIFAKQLKLVLNDLINLNFKICKSGNIF